MSRQNQIPDAWDQDWESIADKQAPQPSEPVPEKKLSARAAKAQRRAEHAEFNRQLWAEAEAPQTFHFLESRSTIPMKSEYKTPMRVLARKPQSNKSGLESGVQGLSIGDQGQVDDDDEDFERKPGQLTYEERVAKAQKEREEKQRKYEEVRERLFGSSTPGSGASSPGNVTPPRQGQHHQGGEGKRRGRNNRSSTGGNRESRERRERENSNASTKPAGRLYDPNYAPKASSNYVQRKEKEQGKEPYASLSQHQVQPQLPSQYTQPQMPIRSPRGPDPSGRGGFGGFPSRGGRGG
ncbi:hypothetical protein McanMca71_004722 [Microsporum canis]